MIGFDRTLLFFFFWWGMGHAVTLAKKDAGPSDGVKSNLLSKDMGSRK